MSLSTSVQLSREITAIAIPAGTPHSLPKNTEVYITQELGGSFTIHANGLLYRIEGKDADALGRKPAASISAEKGEVPELKEEAVWETLKTCFDPEIPVNIVDLGLIYDLSKSCLPSGKYKIFIKMTLTAPGCGMGEVIAQDARQKILSLPSVEDAVVEIVWDPPWHQSMITQEGKRALGLE